MDSSIPSKAEVLEYAGADVYRERISGWRRRFTLSGDRLFIHSRRFFMNESETPVSLYMVDPVYAKGWKREMPAAIAMLIFASLFIVPAWPEILRVPFHLSRLATTINTGLGILFIVGAILNARRIEYVSFASGGGRIYLYRSGPDRKQFDAFVARVVDRIQTLRTKHS